jgi:A/G-specific adenine glycosylase
VLAWYDRVGRDLPWRRTRDPYAILVSEVMAQQTQVARVLPHYERWLERWPTAAALAAAAPAEVLGAWVGLGYNRRALRLREAAAIVASEGWPRDAAGLQRLPGVGPYTAAAVASFAFGERVAAVDTNVRRVAQRIGATPAELLPRRRHGDWNQAAMELGARVCTARAPACDACPAAAWCASRGRVVVAPRAARGSSPRFEETDRWLRGRIVAALAAGDPLPAGIEPARLERALAGLQRDGLVERDARGLGLPRASRGRVCATT